MTNHSPIAKACETPLEEIKDLNPELRRGVTPPNETEYEIKIPYGKKDLFLENFEAMQPLEKFQFKTHLVKKGETLKGIAKLFLILFVTVAYLHRRLEGWKAVFITWRDIQVGHLARLELDWEHIPRPISSSEREIHPLAVDLDLTHWAVVRHTDNSGGISIGVGFAPLRRSSRAARVTNLTMAASCSAFATPTLTYRI